MPYIFTKDIAGYKKGGEFPFEHDGGVIYRFMQQVLIDNGTLVEQGKEERWRPIRLETYWWVSVFGATSRTVFYGDMLDEERYAMGNCYKTYEEAEAAAERVRKALKGE